MRRPYAWAKVERGDIISFRYKSKQGGTSTKRLFLVLEPKLKNQAKKPTTSLAAFSLNTLIQLSSSFCRPLVTLASFVKV